MEEKSTGDTGDFSGENSTRRTGNTEFLLKGWAPWAMLCPCDHSSAPLLPGPLKCARSYHLLRAVPSAFLTGELLWAEEHQALSNQHGHPRGFLSLHSFIELCKTHHLSWLCLYTQYNVHSSVENLPHWKYLHICHMFSIPSKWWNRFLRASPGHHWWSERWCYWRQRYLMRKPLPCYFLSQVFILMGPYWGWQKDRVVLGTESSALCPLHLIPSLIALSLLPVLNPFRTLNPRLNSVRCQGQIEIPANTTGSWNWCHSCRLQFTAIYRM